MSILSVMQRFTILTGLVALMLTGCMQGGAEAPEDVASDAIVIDRAAGETGFAKSEAAAVVEAETAEEMPALAAEPAPADALKIDAAPAAAGGEVVVGEAAMSDAMEPMPTASPPMESGAEFAREESRVEVAQQSQPLRAGEVDDNAQWDDYLLYLHNYYGPPVHARDISERYVVEVTDGQGRPILGATVHFGLPGQQSREIYAARTMANGQVLFHPLALGISLEEADRFVVTVENGDSQQAFSLARFEAQPATSFSDKWTVTLDAQQAQDDSLNLDVLFLIDATGSMADEIAKIQNTIFDVSAQIDALPEHPNVRYGLVSYRDRTDSYITRVYEFTPDVRDFSKNLNTVYADGGDDYPESLNEGLHDALTKVEWRGGNTVQLIFLVADAPPHLDYAQDYDYAKEMQIGAQRGIKIHTIASSGLDDQGEYIFRQIAQYTQGRFIFLTYADDSNRGTPGDTTTHHVEDYRVENLDNLLVRLVREELAFQNPQFTQAQ